jgi:hypothetical protein
MVLEEMITASLLYHWLDFMLCDAVSWKGVWRILLMILWTVHHHHKVKKDCFLIQLLGKSHSRKRDKR